MAIDRAAIALRAQSLRRKTTSLDVIAVCDDIVVLLAALSALDKASNGLDNGVSNNGAVLELKSNKAFDKVAYQREYMRRRRKAAKGNATLDKTGTRN